MGSHWGQAPPERLLTCQSPRFTSRSRSPDYLLDPKSSPFAGNEHEPDKEKREAPAYRLDLPLVGRTAACDRFDERPHCLPAHLFWSLQYLTPGREAPHILDCEANVLLWTQGVHREADSSDQGRKTCHEGR
jgi:hypothetical protein